MNPALRFLRDTGSAALDLLYPPCCAGCGCDLPPDMDLCPDCGKNVTPLRPPFCQRCSQPFDGDITDPFRCPNCGPMTLYFGVASAGCRARGVVRDLIHRFKYDKDTSLRHLLGRWLVAAAQDSRLAGVSFDALVPVPLHPAREREREFNQAVLLAETVSPLLGIPVSRMLRRVRFTETQTHFDRKKRMENLHGAFVPAKNAAVTNLNLLLVDDVFTTGSTVNECARVLRSAGARSVDVITVARG